MDINQSVDPSQDPSQLNSQQLLALIQQQAQQQQPPSGGSSPDDDSNTPTNGGQVDPSMAFHLAAQATMQKHVPTTPGLTAVQPQMPGHGLGSWISKMVTGQPLMHNVGNPVLATGSVPDQSSIPQGMQLQPIGSDANGNPLYDYAAMQKQQGWEGQAAIAQMKNNLQNPILPPDFSTAINSGDYDGAAAALQKAGIPMTPKLQTLISSAKKGDMMASALLGRVANQQTGQGAEMGQLLSAAKAQGDFKTQNDKTSNAIHGLQLVSQYYDPKSGDFNVPANQYNELAQTVAKIATNNPVLSNEMISQINQRTAKGDMAGVADYLGITDPQGQRLTGSTQSVINSMVDMLARQGVTSQSIRDGYVNAVLGAYAGLKQQNPPLYNSIIQSTYGSAPDFAGQLAQQPFAAKYAPLLQSATTNPNRPAPQPGQQPQPMPPQGQPQAPRQPITPQGQAAANPSGLQVGGVIPGTKIKIKSIRLKKA